MIRPRRFVVTGGLLLDGFHCDEVLNIENSYRMTLGIDNRTLIDATPPNQPDRILDQ